MTLRFIITLAALLLTVHPALANPWYEGGTLQKATIADWRNATADNQLATAADFIATLGSIPDITTIQDQAVLDQLRKRAEDLRQCINQNIQQGNAADSDMLANAVVMCTIVKKKDPSNP
jgi:CHASE3 domain sensor protein